jgi:predicted PurR-regulated permease PerM
MEFIPYVWPLIALIPAVIIGFGISWQVALIITILYILIQQTENNFLVPYVMSKNLDLSPFLVFVAMIAWASLGGVMGIILAMPVVWVAKMVYSEYKKWVLHLEKKQNTIATKAPVMKKKNEK